MMRGYDTWKTTEPADWPDAPVAFDLIEQCVSCGGRHVVDEEGWVYHDTPCVWAERVNGELGDTDEQQGVA